MPTSLKLGAILLLTSGIFTAAYSQESPKQPDFGTIEVHVAEALRRGNSVVIAGEGPRGAAQDAQIAATAPPIDDSSMWYISLFKQRNCGACDQLLKDFKTSEFLRCWVEASPGSTLAWAHFNVYDIHDATQKDRIKRYVIAGTPTLVIQPPRNGSWGDPSVVVDQFTGYDGDPKKLGMKISESVNRFARKMALLGYPRHDVRLAGATDPTIGGAVHTPPFPVPSPTPLFQPSNPFPPQLVPQPAPTPTTHPLVDFLTHGSLANLMLILLVAAKAYELYTRTTPSLADDQLASLIISVISVLNPNQPKPPVKDVKAAIQSAKVP